MDLIPAERIERAILLIRGHRVMLDADLARLYGVTTKRLNEQVKRNRDRFPADFVFQLTAGEKAQVVAICDHLQALRFSPVRPHAFTEHGAVMLASVLNSPVAVYTSIQVVRAFVRLREAATSYEELARRLDALETQYDRQFKAVFDAIRKLMEPPRCGRKAGSASGPPPTTRSVSEKLGVALRRYRPTVGCSAPSADFARAPLGSRAPQPRDVRRRALFSWGGLGGVFRHPSELLAAERRQTAH